MKTNPCKNCGEEGTVEPHTCPYLEEICGDSETKCNCCESCQWLCCDEI